jgi:hypothetical protein
VDVIVLVAATTADMPFAPPFYPKRDDRHYSSSTAESFPFPYHQVQTCLTVANILDSSIYIRRGWPAYSCVWHGNVHVVDGIYTL